MAPKREQRPVYRAKLPSKPSKRMAKTKREKAARGWASTIRAITPPTMSCESETMLGEMPIAAREMTIGFSAVSINWRPGAKKRRSKEE